MRRTCSLEGLGFQLRQDIVPEQQDLKVLGPLEITGLYVGDLVVTEIQV